METLAAHRGRESGPELRTSPERRSLEGRRRAVALLVGSALALLTLPALGQTPRERVEMSHEAVTLLAGAEFEVRLERPISTESTEKGDPWTAVVTHPITHGERVLVDRGARVMGVVTAAGPVEVDGETRQVLAVRPMEIEVGTERYPIRAEVIEADPHEHDEKVTGENLAIIGASAGAGALLGALLGDEDQALLGAVLGGAAGTAVAVATEETEIEFHEGSRMTLRLEEPVRVQRPAR